MQKGEKVCLKGFLYQTQEGKWILAREPALKSCCLGSPHNQQTQVLLDGDFSKFSKDKPVRVQGVFHIGLNDTYHLLNASADQKEGLPFWTISLAVLGIVILKFLARFRKKT